MASPIELVGEALQTYWLSPLSLSVLAVCGASFGTLLYVFLTNARNAKLRVSLLTGLYALSIFFWAFVAASFALCVSQARMVAYARNGVPLAVFGAVVGGLAASSVISLLVWRYGNDAVIRKFSPRNANLREAWLQQYVDLVGEFEGVPRVRVRVVESDDALASALVKIANRGTPAKATWGLSILGGAGRGVFSRYPPLKERVHRLLLLSDLLSASLPDSAKD